MFSPALHIIRLLYNPHHREHFRYTVGFGPVFLVAGVLITLLKAFAFSLKGWFGTILFFINIKIKTVCKKHWTCFHLKVGQNNVKEYISELQANTRVLSDLQILKITHANQRYTPDAEIWHWHGINNTICHMTPLSVIMEVLKIAP